MSDYTTAQATAECQCWQCCIIRQRESDAKKIAALTAEIEQLRGERTVTLSDIWAKQEAKIDSDAKMIVALRVELQRIIDHYDTRMELYTNDADLALGLVSIARHAIKQAES